MFKNPVHFFLAGIFFLAAPVFATSEEVRPLFRNKPVLISSDEVEGLKSLSGVTWLPESDHFLFSSSKPPALHEVSLLSRGTQKVRAVKLKEFKKVGALAYVGRAESYEEGVRLAILEEAKAEVSFCDLAPIQGELRRSKCRTYKIDRLLFWEKSFGMEGVAVDRNSDVPVFYFGKEKIPKVIYKGFFKDGQWHVQTGWDAEAMMPPESVISDLFYDQSLFVLDGAGARVLQMDPLTGQTVSEFRIRKNKNYRLTGFCVARRPEGVQMAFVSNKTRYFIYDISEKPASLEERNI